MIEIGLLFVTIGRPDCALRLIESVQRHHPEIQVYVIEQANARGVLADRCSELGYYHELAPYDAGVSYCRNLGIQRIEEELFLLADDDFYFTQPVAYHKLIPLFEKRPSLLMIGGDLDEKNDINGNRPEILLHRGRHILKDSTGHGVMLCSTVFLNTTAMKIEGETFYRCDMVAQWALCRTSLFRSRQLQWDSQFKNNGEHLDFFMNLQAVHPDLEVLYWPGLRCSHAPERDKEYIELRMRDDWQSTFAEKWKLSYQGNLGGAVRLFSEGLEKAHVPAAGEGKYAESVLRLREQVARQRDTITRKDEKIARLEMLLRGK